jgi:tetratricopeptide (TPR) repeat protein
MRCYILFPLVISLFMGQSLMAQDFDDLNDQAFKERDNKNYQKAIDLCTQAINKKVNARSYIIRADCRYELDDYEAAITDFNSALTYYYDYYGSDDKEKGGIYYFRGRSKQKLDRYNEAISDFNTAISYNYKELGYAYWNRGACYYDLGKYKEADDDYIKAIDRISEQEDLSSLYKQRGDCQAKLGKYETAYSLYDRALTYNAKNYNAYWQKGFYKNQEYKYEEGLAGYNKAIEIINNGGTDATGNDLALLYRNKAIMHKTLKQYEEALTAINKSIGSDPNLVRAYRTRAEINILLKKYEAAKADFENAITLETDKKIKSNIYIDRYNMNKKILDYKSSLSDVNKAIEADPADGENFWYRSEYYGYKKNYPLAIKDCNTALELYKNDSSTTASLLWLRAQQKDNSGDFIGAAEDYQTYLKYYPNSYSGYYELGRLFKWKMKNNDLGNANLSKSADLAEKKKDTSKICFIKLVQGDKAGAIKGMLELLQLTSETDEYNYKWNLHNVACIYALAGNASKAFEYLDKSLKAGYDDYLHLINDRDLVTIMKLPQWKTILAKYKVPAVKN